jgi:hypothetical protein
MRAPDDFTGPANTGDSGVFTATAMKLLIGHSEGRPEMARQQSGPRAWCAEATRDCYPLWPVWQTRLSHGSYGFLLGISTGVVAVKAVILELGECERKFTQFQGLAKLGVFSGPNPVSLPDAPRGNTAR